MIHDLIQLIQWWQTGQCDLHGKGSKQCNAATEIASIGISALVGAGLGTAVAGPKGTAVGGLLGLAVGTWLNFGDAPAGAR